METASGKWQHPTQDSRVHDLGKNVTLPKTINEILSPYVSGKFKELYCWPETRTVK